MKKRTSVSLTIIFAVLSVMVSGTVFVLPAHGTVIYVDQDASGDDDGSSWADAYPGLQTALTNASSGDQIWVAEGIYMPTSGNDREATFLLENGVKIYGGFAGTESGLNNRDWTSNSTVLSGDIGTANDITDNSYHVVTGSMTDSTAVLDGFTVTRGNAGSDTFPDHDGGGMFTYNGSPTVANCIFAENTAKTNGGGMFNEGASTTLTDCTFTNNSAVLGGGIYNLHGTPVAENCTFTGNTAGDSGGGIYSYNSDPVLVNCTFSSNTADSGGGMYIYGSEPKITNCTFAYNTAGSGGGLYLTEKSILNITNTLVAENQKTDSSYEDFFKDTGSQVNSGYNIVEFSSGHVFSGPGDIGGDQASLNLGTLDDNGGTTQTCALLTDSVAISGGTDTDAPDTDQRGYPRNAPVDIGAYEYQGKATVKTTGVSSVTTDSASVGGDVVMDGGEEVTERGVCWSTSSISETATPASLSHATNGTGMGKFSCSLAELISGETYYVRAYATNAVGTSFGSEMSFTTKSVPEVTTAGAESVTSESASTGGTVVSDGGYDVDHRGVCWGTSPIPVSSDPLSIGHTAAGTGTGTFRSYLSDLIPGTTYYVRAYAVNDAGAAFGSQITFVTHKTVPTGITTARPGSVTMVSAESGGNILSDGGVPITARGVCWSVSENPTVNGARTEDGTGAGVFFSEITELNAGTTYYVRAYATNGIGTAYGQQVSFITVTLPTLTTFPVIYIKRNSASSGGDVIFEGEADVTARGICWDTQSVPDSADPAEIGHTVNGAGRGNFFSEMDELSPGTDYYVRAYATNSGGTGFGNQIHFKTKPASYPTVITGETETVTSVAATVKGNVTDTGGVPLVAKGICWRRSSVPIIEKHDPLENAGGEDEDFSVRIEGLLPGTEYVARAYATNVDGFTAYGLEVFFTTATPLGVVTAPVTSVTGTEALSGGSVTGTDGYQVTARGVCWSTSGDPETDSNDGIATHETTAEGSFTSSVTPLNPGTTYYLRAYVSNTAETAYGDTKTFTTLAPPAVLTVGVDSVTSVTASVSGEITGDGGEPVTARGVCWNTSQEPDMENGAVCTQEGMGTGVFESFIAGLTPHTTHYVRAYATNITGTSYGNEIAFETHVMPGDVNGDSTVDLIDAVLGLKVLAGADTADAEIHAGADVDGDGKIGMDDILCILRKVLSSVTVRGYVSSGGIRLPSARVRIRSESSAAYTDRNGNFTFHISEGEFPEGPDGAVFPIEVTADGYSSGYAKVARFPGRSDYSVEVKLVPVSEEITAEDDLSEGVGIEKDGEKIGELKLPNSALPAGVTQVTGTVTYLDPTTPDIDSFPGGDFQAVTEGGDPNEPVMLESLGLMEFNLEDQDGNRITELDSDASVCMKVPDGLDAAVGEIIPLWWFNTETGLWVEDGEGIVESRDDGLWMCGSVSHFTWWNFDKPVTSHSCFKFTFVKELDGSPVTGFEWYAEGATYSGKAPERPCNCDDNDPAPCDERNNISSFTVKKTTDSSKPEQIRVYTVKNGVRYYLKDNNGAFSLITDMSQAPVFDAPDAQGSCTRNRDVDQCRFLDGEDGIIPLGGINYTPDIISLTGETNRIYTGKSTRVTALISDSEGDDVSVNWSSECGVISNPDPGLDIDVPAEPGEPLTSSADFTASQAGKCKIIFTARDKGGNTSESHMWIYADIDRELPVIMSTRLVDGNIVVQFSKDMDASTITPEAFSMSSEITGTVTYEDKTATFKPLVAFAHETLYTLTITTAVKDTSGNSTHSDYVWSFQLGTFTDIMLAAGDTYSLDFPVADAAFDTSRGVVYLSSKENKKIYCVNLGNGNIENEYTFSYMPEHMTISPDYKRMYIGLLTQKHSPYWWNDEQEGYIAVFDLNSRSETTRYKIPLDPFDMVVTSDGYLYVSGGSGQHTYLDKYNANTGELSDRGFGTISDRSYIELHPSEKYIYAADTGVSPSDIEKLGISEGVLVYLWDSPYHGDHRMNGYVHIDPTGTVLLTRGGDLFTSSDDRDSDMVFIQELAENYPSSYSRNVFDATFDLVHGYIVTVENPGIRYYYYSTYSLVDTVPLTTGINDWQGSKNFLSFSDNYKELYYVRGDETSTEFTILNVVPK
ncbi:MAG: hypothetical protein GY749_09215 [Desulfobacteraceae bacterium]|nr:hypothetical protein [Desulfobacteraceae bacterium]